MRFKSLSLNSEVNRAAGGLPTNELLLGRSGSLSLFEQTPSIELLSEHYA